MEESLQRLSIFLEKDVELRRKVKSAMTYPILIAIMAVGIVTFLVTWFVPQWVDILTDLGLKGDQLPGPTKLLIGISNVVGHYGHFVVIGIVIYVFAIRAFKTTRFGLRVMDRIKLKMPVFGKLHHKVCLARFSRTMATPAHLGRPHPSGDGDGGGHHRQLDHVGRASRKPCPYPGGRPDSATRSKPRSCSRRWSST